MLNRDIFSQRLIELRNKKKVMSKDIALCIGVSKQAFSQYEKQQSTPSADILLAIADYFEVSLDYLTGRTDNKYMQNDYNDLSYVKEESAPYISSSKNFKQGIIADIDFDNFSKRLKKLRTTNNLTLSQLGNYIGVTKSTVGNLENGEIPSLEIILSIAEYFNISLDYLLSRTNNPNLLDNTNQIVSSEETELLEYFRLLNKHEQNIIMGRISEMIYNKNVEKNKLEVSKELAELNYQNKVNK